MDNKSSESITFEVESELSKPKRFLYNDKIKDILSSIFIRAKSKKSSCDIFGFKGNKDKMENLNESMEILNYNFDTDQKEFFNWGKKSLIRGLMEAYGNHYPITVSPDMILILFLQGYSRFMENNSEKLRNIYVNFEGKKTLIVQRRGITPETAKPEDFQGIIDEFTQKIKNEIGENIISNLECNFTTSNSVTLATSQMSIMSAMKNYFIYKEIMCVCGISSIKLEGSLEDWVKIKKKFEFFSKEEFGLNSWIKYLIPIIDKIIETKIYYNQNKAINNEIRNFWKDMIRVKRGDCYIPDVIDGWIIKFIPNLSKKEPTIYEYLNDDDIPDQIINCPVELIFSNGNSTIEYDCSLASGFYGMIQDKTTFNVKPVIGYTIVVENKKINNSMCLIN